MGQSPISGVSEMNWRFNHFLMFILVVSMCASGFTSLLYAWGDAADAPSSETDLKARAASEIQSVENAVSAPNLPGEALVLSSSGSSPQVCWRDNPDGSLVIENCPARPAHVA